MKEKKTEIIFLLDRSGSMSHLTEDTIGGFNSFVKKQSKLGETILTTVLFDDKYELLHNGIDPKGVKITEEEYYTRGMTALLDAIGKTISDVKTRHKNLKEEKPDKVLFVITTDGLENASCEYDYKRIHSMIKNQTKKEGWEFIFMGANINVAKESKKMGISRNNAFVYKASVAGTKAMYDQLDVMAEQFRNE